MTYLFWMHTDHFLHDHHCLPKKIRRWVCNKLDEVLGLYDDE